MNDFAETTSGSLARKPRQERSRRSLQKMLQTAKRMLAKEGYSAFTLQELSKRSDVSIGSIYHRFENKQELVRHVQVDVLETIENEHAVLVNQLRRRKLPLRKLVPAVVRTYGEFLHKHAPILRVFMELAPQDAVISETGKRYFAQSMLDLKFLLLDARAEIGHSDPEHAVDAALNIIYAVLGRYLGLSMARDVIGEGDWNVLVEDLSLMTLLFLQVGHEA